MKSRAEKLVQQMVDKRLIHNTPESRAQQLAEVSRLNLECLGTLERVVAKQPAPKVYRKRIGD